MDYKKIGVFLLICFLFFTNSIFAEVIGNLKFDPPVSLKEWSILKSIEDEETSLKMHSHKYEYELKNMNEFLFLMNFYSKELPVYSKGYSKEANVENYLINKYQKILDEACKTDKSYSNPKVLVSNIVSDPTSIFYQVTMLAEGKVFACIWGREIKRKGQWIWFQYGLREKCPGDPNFLVQDLEKIAAPWIKFLKDDFFRGAVCLN